MREVRESWSLGDGREADVDSDKDSWLFEIESECA